MPLRVSTDDVLARHRDGLTDRADLDRQIDDQICADVQLYAAGDSRLEPLGRCGDGVTAHGERLRRIDAVAAGIDRPRKSGILFFYHHFGVRDDGAALDPEQFR